ncbi:MAG: MoaD/ThiS family protein [Myxococcales bacterium]|nr:MoaD/ThiS family protein [Myxococcales bacterium]
MLLFAAARETVGSAETTLSLAAPATARAVLDALTEAHPGLRGYHRAMRVAINGAYARDDDPVAAGDEVAIIPPVAGG